MTTTIQNLSDLQDRRIMMDKKLPPYGYAFVILTGLFMIFLVIWSTQTNRIYVSQNSGVVQAANKTYIMSSYSGSITELYVSEGSYVNEGDLIARLKSTDLDMQKDTLQSQLDIYQKQLDQYNKLLKCIQDDTNYFDETSAEDQPYYYQYQTYKSQVAQKTFDASTYQAAGYSDTQIKALMEQNQSELESLYYSTMQSISQSINSAQVNVDNLQAQMDSLNTGANDYFIYAPTSGVIHMDTPYKEGMVLSAGSAMATIASENDDLEIVAMVSVNDRPLLHVGDPCKIAITGLSEYSYGTLTGTVTSIDSDVTSSTSGSYYKMTIKPDATYVVSRSGDKVDLSNGMSVLVGRNNKENDILTFKTAGNKDLWLHTKDIPGSHVIVQSGGVELDEEAVWEAAAIAAYHSKARTSENVPVDYVQIKYVKKPVGAKPGMVIFTNNRTVYVNPAVPK